MSRYRPELGTPPEIVERLALESEKAMSADGMRELRLKFSQYPDYKGPAAFTKQIQSDNAVYRDLINLAGIKIDP
jgi:tripartite-type tricarboxylate transporter receptor subunit TctC